MAAPAAFFNNGARQVQPQVDDAADRRLEQRLRLYGAVYMMLGTMVLLRAAFPEANRYAVGGLLLWAAALALVLLAGQHRRFPLAARAAARLAQAAIGAFF